MLAEQWVDAVGKVVDLKGCSSTLKMSHFL
jgi:hypothetical protein